MAVILKTPEQIEIMRESAQVVSRTLGLMASKIDAGITPLELDKLAFEFMADQGASPTFLNYNGYPNSLCISVNQVIVHGIPTNVPFREGDIVSVDCGAFKNGYHGDHAYTFAIGEVKEEVKKLLQITYESLLLGIEKTIAGNRIGDIGNAIQSHSEKHGYGVVRDLVGHGLGTELHEDPQVPNYGKRGSGPKIQNGMVLAIEPMINMGTRNIKHLRDGWTIVTADGKPSAHFEHDVAVVDGKPDVLSTFRFVEEELDKRGFWRVS